MYCWVHFFLSSKEFINKNSSMGTGGIIVLRHKRLLFHFWRKYDAYFDGLGDWLVSDIRRSPKSLNLWRACLDLVRPFLNNNKYNHLPFPEPKKKELEALLAQVGDGEIKNCFENFSMDDEERFPMWIAREYDYDNPWVAGFVFNSYVVCLDEEVFHAVDWSARWITRWSFKEIPDDWVKIAKEKSGERSSIFVFQSFYADRKADLSSAGHESVECMEHSTISSVWRVVEQSTGTNRVIKINESRKHRREITVAKDSLEHKPPHLVGIVNVTKLAVQQDTDSTLFEERIDGECYDSDFVDSKEAIIMECYDGDFEDFHKTIMMPLLPEKKDEFVLYQLAFLKDVALGIRELHKLGYVHYDVKPRNILYKKDEVGLYRFVLCDFEGASRPLKDQTDSLGNDLRGSDRWESGWGLLMHTPDFETHRQYSCPPFHVDFDILAACFRHTFKKTDFTLVAPLLAVFEDEEKDDEAKIQDVSKLVDSITASLRSPPARKRRLHDTAQDGDQGAT
jgi:serine/threonine protein kinase